MLRTILIIAATSLLCTVSYAQTKVGDNVLDIDSASILELESSSRGFLPSRMTTAQRDAQTSWDEAHIIYNTTENCLQIYTGSLWLCIQQGTPIDSSIYKQNGSLRSDRIVMMNNNDLTFDGSRDIIITDDGRLGIGDLSPDALLDVEGGTVRLSDYGSGANPGQRTFLLGVDSDGDVIEVDTASVGTDDQTIDALFIRNDTLFISLEDDGESDLYINLAPYLDGDTDWLAFGGSAADNISDTIYTFGNVGINTNSPSAALHVVDRTDTYAGPWAIIEGGGGVVSNTALQLYDKGTGANNQNIVEFAHRVSGNPVALATIRSNTDGADHVNGADLILETSSDDSGTLNSNQLYLKNDGNIGIGTSTPDEDLHIAGDMRLDGSFEDKDGDAGTSGDVLTSTVTGTNWVSAITIGSDDQIIDSLALEGNSLHIGLENDVNGLQSLDLSPLIDTDWLAIDGLRATSINDSIYTLGRVGIGVTNPAGKLHVSTEGSEDVLLTRFDNDVSNDLDLDFIGGEGTPSAPTQYSGLSTGNRMGGVRFRSYVDPSSISSNLLDAFAPIAEIAGETDGTFSATSAPGRLVFSTTSQGNNRPSERMVIKNNGRVGINLSAPAELLHIGGNMRLDSAFKDKDGDAGTSGDVLTSTVTGTDWVSASTVGTDNQTIDVFNINGSNLLQLSLEDDGEPTKTVNLSPYLDDQTVSITGAGINVVTGTYPSFTITGTEVDGSITNETITGFSYTASSGRLRITESGTNHDAIVAVMSGAGAGTAGVRGLVPDASAGEQTYLLTAAGTWIDPTSISGSNIYTADGTLTGNRTVGLSTYDLIFDGSSDVIIESGGDVGIGTTNPDARLHVSGGAGSVELLLEADTNNVGESDQPRLTFKQDGGAIQGHLGFTDGSNTLKLSNDSNNSIEFQTNGSTKVTVRGSGNVGIGTTSPGARLEVVGGSVIFDEYGVGTYADTSADYILATNIDGDVVELNTAKNTRWFYPPPFVLDASVTTTGESLDIHAAYVNQFTNGSGATNFVKSASAGSSLPVYSETELAYWIVYYDDDVLDNVLVSDSGVLTYDIIAVPDDNYTIITIIFEIL